MADNYITARRRKARCRKTRAGALDSVPAGMRHHCGFQRLGDPARRQIPRLYLLSGLQSAYGRFKGGLAPTIDTKRLCEVMSQDLKYFDKIY